MLTAVLPLVIAPALGSVVPLRAHSQFSGSNYVGDFWVWGDNTGYDTTGTLAVQVIGRQPPNDPTHAMTQTVNSTVAKAHSGTGSSCGTNLGCFKIYTQPTQDANAYALPPGTYDVNTINIGYTNHTTWFNPDGDCMSWRPPSPVTKVGTVTIGLAGKITAARDASGDPLIVTGGIAGEYKIPTSYVPNTSPQEAGICISDSTSTNGNQAPLTLMPLNAPPGQGKTCQMGSGASSPPAEPGAPPGQALPVNFRDASGTYGISIQLEAGRLDTGSFDFEVDGLGDYMGTMTVAPGSEPSSFVIGAAVPVRFFPTGGGPPTAATMHLAGSVDTVTYSALITVVNQTNTNTYVIKTAKANVADALNASMTACTAMVNQDYASLYTLFDPKLMTGVTQSAFTAAMNAQNTPTIQQITLNGAGYQQPTSYGFTYFVQPVTLQTSVGQRTANMYFVLENGKWYLLSTDPVS